MKTGKYARIVMGMIALVLAFSGCTSEAGQADAPEIVRKAAVSGLVQGEDGSPLLSQVVFFGERGTVRVNTDILGHYETELELGNYAMEVTKGSLYERVAVSLEVPDRNDLFMDTITLRQLYDLPGWLAGDLHQHSMYSFDANDTPGEILLANLAAGLDFGVITDHNNTQANAEFTGAGAYGFIAFPGVEVTTNRGHYNAFGLDRIVDFDVTGGKTDIERIVADVRTDDSAVLQINHPVRTMDSFQFQDWEMVTLFDTIEIWNGKSPPPPVEGEPNALSREKWFELLNDGIFIPATGGSDNHNIGGTPPPADSGLDYYYTGMFSGMPRTYVFVSDPTTSGVLEALTKGRGFLTNNPLAFLRADGALPGETVKPGTVDIAVEVRSNRGLTSCRLIQNGREILAQEFAGLTADFQHTMELKAGDWIVLEVFGEGGDYALTNPIRVGA